MAQIGDRVRVSWTYTALGSGALTDPDVVKLIHRKPSGTETVYVYEVDEEIVRDSLGTYHADILLDEYRTHWFRQIGEGTVDKCLETSVEVSESQFQDPTP
jgi:hypothetical protein